MSPYFLANIQSTAVAQLSGLALEAHTSFKLLKPTKHNLT